MTLCFASARLICAQEATGRLTVQVRVVDTSGAPLPGVDVSILQGLQEVLANGPTDSSGYRRLAVPRRSGAYQLTTRRIGYQRGDRFFPAPKGDTIAFVVEMRRSVQALEAVTISAREDVRRRSYHIDADEIARSTRVILDALDVVRKLKPDMMLGRSGLCPLQNVWVNGRREVDYMPNAMVAARRPMAAPNGPIQNGARPLPTPKLLSTSESAWSVLSSIKPEHIAEINYADCEDTTVDKVHAQAAAFVVLKPGVNFELGVGSFVDLRFADSLSTSLPPLAPRAAEAFRHRILGVFDQTTGQALAGVEVIDLGTGTVALTTTTGTVSLGYLAEGANKVRLHKAGYGDVDLDVTISPATTTPITALLIKH